MSEDPNMRKTIACATVFGLALVARGPVLAESEGGDDDGGGPAVPSVVRPVHDVACTLRVDASGAAGGGSGITTKLVVKNKSRKREPNVQVSIFANAPVGAPLWTGTLDLKAHRRRSQTVHVDPPPGTTSLVAVAACDDDDNPGNNIAGVEVPEGDDDGPAGTPVPPAANASALAGAATYAANCASCHGADAKGTQFAPPILHRSAGSVLEALREGEDGMPRFAGLTSADASNLAAFLADPSAATQPGTPIPPPPSGTAPTYTGQIATLLQANCVVCHSGASASGSTVTGPVQLDSYVNASKNASLALAALQGGIMPPGGALPASSVQLFSDWIAGGKQQ
jgi:mono/diheme cytochrome c family protein